MKQNKSLILLTSAMALLPMLVGLILWGRLPDRVPVHFDFSGQANGYGAKAFAVFGLPLFLMAVHLLCLFGVSRDARSENAGKVMNRMVLWIVPAVAVLVTASIYPSALGVRVNITLFGMLFCGLVFVTLGNYLPKCRQNSVIGIRVPWTLLDEEVWNKTHRMAGPLWVVGGLVILVEAFAGIAASTVFLAVVFLCGGAPVLYAGFLYYRKRA